MLGLHGVDVQVDGGDAGPLAGPLAGQVPARTGLCQAVLVSDRPTKKTIHICKLKVAFLRSWGSR